MYQSNSFKIVLAVFLLAAAMAIFVIAGKSECGDGFRSVTEMCDDANTYDGDGCTSTCKIQKGYICSLSEPSVCELIN